MKISSQYDVNAVAGVLSWMTFDDVAKAADHDFSKATVTELKTLDGVHAMIRSIPAMDKDGKDDKKARSEEHPSELQPLLRISYGAFRSKQQQHTTTNTHTA